MPYVIVSACIGHKDGSCVEVCPVDCIHPTPDDPRYAEAEQLHIDPAECIDCDACVAACPHDAVSPAEELTGDDLAAVARNADWFR
jgi:ferredoxin